MCTGYCATLWDAEVNETLALSLRFKGHYRRQKCKQARVPAADIRNYGDVLEPGVRETSRRGFLEEIVPS